MANRKVLINRHTTGNTAPNAAEMFHGEIAVSHPLGDASATTIYTRNNDVMVPFISCAQTIAIIDSKVKASEDVVKAKAGELHLEVESAGTPDATEWILSTKDVQSEEEFKAYSAATKIRIDKNESGITTLTEALADLTDIVVTALTGDDIISIDPATTGANAYQILHAQALTTDGFNKLATDAYGHVTASTAVVTADIQALGFKTSAETGEDLSELSASVVTNKANIEALSAGTVQVSGDIVTYVNELSANTHNKIVEVYGSANSYTDAAISAAVEALDSATAVTAGKYLTGIAIADGKISGITEADLPVLASAKTGTGNVVTDIAVDDHTITFDLGATVATDADLQALSAATIALSAGTLHDIEELSGNVVEYVKVVSGNIETVINELSGAVEANEDHIEELSGATQAISGYAATQIEQLSAGTIMVSGYAHGEIAELSAGTVALGDSVFASAKTYTDEEIEELSGVTDAAILAAIQALDSSVSADTGKYFTALAIEDGKLVAKEEADIPVLASAKTGTGNVVTDIAVNDHTITFDLGATVATDAQLQELSASVVANEDHIEELSGATEAISGYAATQIEQLSAGTIMVSGYAHDEIAALSAGTIQLSADTYAAINQLSGYAHGEIAELSGAVQANETDIDNLSAATLDLSAVTLTGVSLNNTPLAVSNHIVSVPVAVAGSEIAEAEDSGSVADAKAVREYVEGIVSSAVNYKGATSGEPTGTPVVGDLWIADSAFTIDGKNVEVGDFIIYGENGWDVIQKNLDGAITGNLTADTVTLGDGLHTAKSLANGAQGTVLTIGTAGTPVWANDPELSVVSAGTGNVLTNITVDDHEITFTKGITAASDADLQALSGAVEDFSGATDAKFIELSAYTKDVDDKVKALSAGTIQLSADTVAYVDAQIDEVYASGVSYTDAKVAAEIALLDSVGSASTTGHYLTSVTITDGKISAVGEVAVPAAVAITATTGAAVDTPSAVLTGVTADGTDNHNLTFGMSNKVFSAASSDSALTSESALTAEEAEKVANALSFSGYSTSSASSLDTAFAYDGAEAKALTFGTVGNAGLSSMSMTSAGLVDVEVIDCGEY